MENSVTFDPSLEHGAKFRFPVTWSYLTETPLPARPDPNVVISHVAVLPAPVAAAVPALLPSPKPTEARKPTEDLKPVAPRASGPETKWEMVIPKMARPIALRPTSRAPRALPQETVPAAEAPTEISFYAGSEASFLPQRWKVLSISVAVVVVGCVIAWVRPGGDAASGGEPAPTAAGTWSRRTARVVGAKDPREILVYSGSEGLKNYRIEFAWVPDPRGVGWIFRATDSANYYAANLRLLEAGAAPTLSMEHFAVVKGVESTHSRKVTTLNRTQSQVLVRMDANGPAFTLYLQGSPVDYWTDERFETGSLGFYEERGERPVLQALRFTLFKKSGLQTVVTSLQ